MRLDEIAHTGFKSDTTGMPHYDQMMELPDYYREEKGLKFNIYKNWSPQKYIERAAEGFRTSVDQMTSSRDSELIDKYAEKMRTGEKFPMLTLDYSNGFSQEGVHRAMAAIKAGISTVPVMVVRRSAHW